jgi:hypothetical protein
MKDNACLRRIAIAAFLCVLGMAPARAEQVEVNNPLMTVSKDADMVELVYTVINTGVASNMPVTIGDPTEFIKPFFDGPTNDTKNHVLTIGPIDSMCGTLAVKASCTVDAFFGVLDGDPFNKVNPAQNGVWLAVLSVPWTTSDGLLSGTGFGLGGVKISVTLTGAAIAGIPEPSTWAMLLVGFGGVGFMAWRRSVPARAVVIGGGALSST